MHSNYSDGSFSPRQLVEYALTHNISAFALTDHDTVAGLPEALAYAGELSGRICDANPEGKALEVIPGIEFSTEYEGRDIHIVGLYIDYTADHFTQHLNDFVASREARNEKICALLTEHGVPVTYSAIKSRFPGAVITRAHYARYLLEEGCVRSMSEAFDRYVGDHAPCFIPREKVSPAQAVSLIRSVSGIPILAHPTLYHMSTGRLKDLVAQLKEIGLLGIEGIYSSYSVSETREMQSIAKEFGLLISGGSDFHGDNKPGLHFGTGYGKLYIHEDILENIKKKRQSI